MKKLFAIIASTFAATAFAHPGHDAASGAMAGFMHPLTGIDHLIALMCVGALLAGASRRARSQGVAALICSLAAGAALGLTGFVLPASEWVIALSVLVAGVMLLRANTTRPALLVAGIAVFALFHGYAHGVEATGQTLAFVAAFLASSIAIVVTSMTVTMLVRQFAFRAVLGAGAAVTGFALLASLAT